MPGLKLFGNYVNLEHDFILQDGFFFYLDYYENKKCVVLPCLTPDVQFLGYVEEKYNDCLRQENYETAMIIAATLKDKKEKNSRPLTKTEERYLAMSIEEQEEYIKTITNPKTYTELIFPEEIVLGDEVLPLVVIGKANSWLDERYINLRTIHLPSKLQVYDNICSCPNLEEIIVPENNEYLLTNHGALYDLCEKCLLAAPKKPTGTFRVLDGTQTINSFAFEGSNYEEIILPESLILIKSEAFNDCFSLTSVLIPDSVTKIGGHAFTGCKSLESITCYAMIPPILEDSFGGLRSIPVYVPDEVIEAYKKTDGWKEFENILPISAKKQTTKK